MAQKAFGAHAALQRLTNGDEGASEGCLAQQLRPSTTQLRLPPVGPLYRSSDGWTCR